MSSLSSESSQGTPEPKRVGNTRQMADVVNGASNVGETRNDPQVPALAAIWEVVVRIEANTNLLINEHKALKTHSEELQKSLQLTIYPSRRGRHEERKSEAKRYGEGS